MLSQAINCFRIFFAQLFKSVGKKIQENHFKRLIRTKEKMYYKNLTSYIINILVKTMHYRQTENLHSIKIVVENKNILNNYLW